MEKNFVRLKEDGQIVYKEKQGGDNHHSPAVSKYAAKVLTANGGNVINEKPFIIVAFGTWSNDWLAFDGLFSCLPIGVDLTRIEVPAGQSVAVGVGMTKALIFERIIY